MSAPKKHIPTNAAETPREELNAAFARLSLSNLPPAPTTPPPSTAAAPPVWKMGRVVLRRETAHRGGKTVIVVDDFATHLPVSVIERIAKKLRAACGCGGTVRGRVVEVQGDQAPRIRALLEAEGFQVAGIK